MTDILAIQFAVCTKNAKRVQWPCVLIRLQIVPDSLTDCRRLNSQCHPDLTRLSGQLWVV